MGPVIETVDGSKLSAFELKEMILKADRPFVIRNRIASWEAAKWSLAEFTELFGKIQTRFKLLRKIKIGNGPACDLEPPIKISRLGDNINSRTVGNVGHKAPMETDCVYQNGTFGDFQKWLDGKDATKDTSLCDFPRYQL